MNAMKYEKFIGEFYDDVADKMQKVADEEHSEINLIFDNYGIEYMQDDRKRVNVYIDYITYKIYRIEEGRQA